MREQEGDQTKGLTLANGDLSTLIENSECNFEVHVYHNNNNNKCTSQYLSLPGWVKFPRKATNSLNELLF